VQCRLSGNGPCELQTSRWGVHAVSISVVGVCRVASGLLAVVTILMGMPLVAGCSDTQSSIPVGRADGSLPVPPPAMSAVDRTVFVTWALEDSFDVLPGGTCAGRSTNRGMSDRARVLLTGKTTGLSDETVASAFYKQTPPRMYHGKPMLDDDYRYCVITAVWSPAVPDPDGYTYKLDGDSTRIRGVTR
jgi:hypothetical protein